MKKPFICLCAGVMLFTLAGCSTDYVMTTKSGQTIVTKANRSWIKTPG